MQGFCSLISILSLAFAGIQQHAKAHAVGALSDSRATQQFYWYEQEDQKTM